MNSSKEDRMLPERTLKRVCDHQHDKAEDMIRSHAGEVYYVFPSINGEINIGTEEYDIHFNALADYDCSDMVMSLNVPWLERYKGCMRENLGKITTIAFRSIEYEKAKISSPLLIPINLCFTCFNFCRCSQRLLYSTLNRWSLMGKDRCTMFYHSARKILRTVSRRISDRSNELREVAEVSLENSKAFEELMEKLISESTLGEIACMNIAQVMKIGMTALALRNPTIGKVTNYHESIMQTFRDQFNKSDKNILGLSVLNDLRSRVFVRLYPILLWMPFIKVIAGVTVGSMMHINPLPKTMRRATVRFLVHKDLYHLDKFADPESEAIIKRHNFSGHYVSVSCNHDSLIHAVTMLYNQSTMENKEFVIELDSPTLLILCEGDIAIRAVLKHIVDVLTSNVDHLDRDAQYHYRMLLHGTFGSIFPHIRNMVYEDLIKWFCFHVIYNSNFNGLPDVSVVDQLMVMKTMDEMHEMVLTRRQEILIESEEKQPVSTKSKKKNANKKKKKGTAKVVVPLSEEEVEVVELEVEEEEVILFNGFQKPPVLETSSSMNDGEYISYITDPTHLDEVFDGLPEYHWE